MQAVTDHQGTSQREDKDNLPLVLSASCQISNISWAQLQLDGVSENDWRGRWRAAMA